MKKLVSLLLALSLLLTCCAAMAEDDRTAHYDYSASYIGASGAEKDELYDYICGMFNVDFDMVSYGWGDYASNASMMINGQTMLDVLTVDTGFEMISSYAEQGLIRPLPDNWEEKYPNIYTYLKNSSLVDLIREDDGRVYCIPKAIYAHFTTGDVYLWHYTLYYRADWAQELGYTFGDTVTISELAAFCRDAVARDMAGNGKTIGLTLRSSMLQELMRLSNPYYNTFTKVDGQYIWGPTMDTTAEGIRQVKSLYNEGVLDPDFYVNGTGAEMSAFTSGQAACMIYDGLVGSYDGLINDMVSSGIAADRDDAFAKTNVTVLVNDDQVWYGNETSNYCWATVFSNDMSEEEFLRLMDLYDWLYSREGELTYNLGIEGVSWYEDEGAFRNIYYDNDGNMGTVDFDRNVYALIRNEDGTYTQGEKVGNLQDPDNTYASMEYPSKVFWFRQAILGDDFMLVDPNANPTTIERIARCYSTRYENAMEHGYRKTDYDFAFFSSDAKSQYSVSIDDEILRLVSDKTIAMDAVDGEWAAFIENYRSMWEPVVKDLNDAFAQ
ncbi:MAG: extracellular solute-binding protein [Aristaeellaceae bacterium]